MNTRTHRPSTLSRDVSWALAFIALGGLLVIALILSPVTIGAMFAGVDFFEEVE